MATREEFDAIQQRILEHSQAKARERAEWAALCEQAVSRRAAFARGEVPPVKPQDMPTLTQVYAANQATTRAAEAEAERLRREAMTPEQVAAEQERIRRSTLPWQERQRIDTWERVNKTAYPVH